MLFINKTYEKYVRNIEISCEFGIFLKVKKEFLQLDKDLILSCMYLPPQGSPFYDELQVNGIDLFEDVFVTLFSQFSDCYFLTMGDLNCRTGNLPDFEIFENNVDMLDQFEDMFDNFNEPRSSSDIHVTSLGRRLLSFCQLYSIYILNGRVGGDKILDILHISGQTDVALLIMRWHQSSSLTIYVTLLLRNVQNLRICRLWFNLNLIR